MVFFFTSQFDDSYLIYVGKHKEENEELLKWALPIDVWYHVDNFSSPHVYLRLKEGQTIDDIPEEIHEECCQLTKAGSISGCKESVVNVIYTPYPNLHKTKAMEAGAVGFHNEKAVKKRRCATNRALVKALNKTKVEKFPDLKKEREAWEREQRLREKAAKQEAAKQAKLDAQRNKEAKKIREYDGFFDEEEEERPTDVSVNDYEEDFM